MPSEQDTTANEEDRRSYISGEYNIYPKSNTLISGKYKSSLLENKIMAYSLAHAYEFDIGSHERETIKSVMKVADLRKAIGGNSGSFYRQLSDIAELMTGRKIGIRSEDNATFDYIAVVTRASCRNGFFTIEYNGAIRGMLVDLKRNYSRLNLTIQMRFTNNYSFRLYELLKQKCYYLNDDSTKRSGDFTVEIGLAELKLEMGIVNADLDNVKKILMRSKNPDFERAVEASPERSFDKWYEFRRGVLDKAVSEINGMSDLHVSYEPVRRGKGGKICALHFFIKQVPLSEPVELVSLTDEEKIDFLVEATTLSGGAFTARDMRVVAEASGWNMDRIRNAHALLQEQKVVKNPVGWMVEAVKNGYVAPQVKKKRNTAKAAKAGSFCDFDQRDYDYADLERKLASL